MAVQCSPSVSVSEPTLPFGLGEALLIADWKRRVTEIYGEIRAARGERSAWDQWRNTRDELLGHHPRSSAKHCDTRDEQGRSPTDDAPGGGLFRSLRDVSQS